MFFSYELNIPEKKNESTVISLASFRHSLYKKSMEFQTTTNHDVIKEWGKEHGARPAIVQGAERTNPLSLRFVFEDDNPDFEYIRWEEFLDLFEAANLAFHYSNDVKKGDEEASFNFIDREKNIPDEPNAEDQTELPDPVAEDDNRITPDEKI
jgi:hypothetical protein